jgi:membrane-associated two-gene conflict system component 1 (EACC1)
MISSSSGERHEVELAVSDPAQLSSLRDWLRGQPDVSVAVTPGTPGPGEQGALDVLTVLAGSSGLVAAIKVLPEFIRSRRSGFRIEATVRGEKLVLDATNVDEVLPVLERLLGD